MIVMLPMENEFRPVLVVVGDHGQRVVNNSVVANQIADWLKIELRFFNLEYKLLGKPSKKTA